MSALGHLSSCPSRPPCQPVFRGVPAPMSSSRRPPSARSRRQRGNDGAPHGLPTDLERLVAAIAGAAERTKMRPARTPWPAPLPDIVQLTDLLGGTRSRAAFQSPWSMSPRSSGCPPGGGTRAGGTSSATECPGRGSMSSSRPSWSRCRAGAPRLHRATPTCSGSGPIVSTTWPISPMSARWWPPTTASARSGCSASCAASWREDAAAATTSPRLLLVIDDYAGLRAAFDGYKDVQLLEMVARLIADGAALGINVVACGRQAMSIPLRVAGTVATRLAFAFADPMDVTILGLRLRNIPTLPHGRAVDASTGLIVQAATSWSGVAVPEVEPCPYPVEVMPDTVERGEMGSASHHRGVLADTGGDRRARTRPRWICCSTCRTTPWSAVAHGQGRAPCWRRWPRLRPSLPGVTVTAFAPRRSPLRESAAHRVVTDPADLPPLSSTRSSPRRVRTSSWWTMPMPPTIRGVSRPAYRRQTRTGSCCGRRDGPTSCAAPTTTGRVRYASRRSASCSTPMSPTPNCSASSSRRPAAGARPPGRGYLIESGFAQLVQIAR